MKQKMTLPVLILIAVVVLITVGAGSFYAGTKYTSAKRFSVFAKGDFGPGMQQGANSTIRRVGQGQGGGMVNGDILSLDAKSLTVKTRDGGSKIVLFASSTEIGKFVSGAISDLTSGQNVMVVGKTNNDGSVTAQSIQIRPANTNPVSGPAGAPNNQ